MSGERCLNVACAYVPHLRCTRNAVYIRSVPVVCLGMPQHMCVDPAAQRLSSPRHSRWVPDVFLTVFVCSAYRLIVARATLRAPSLSKPFTFWPLLHLLHQSSGHLQPYRICSLVHARMWARYLSLWHHKYRHEDEVVVPHAFNRACNDTGQNRSVLGRSALLGWMSTFTLPSSEPVVNLRSEGAHAAERADSLCARIFCTPTLSGVQRIPELHSDSLLQQPGYSYKSIILQRKYTTTELRRIVAYKHWKHCKACVRMPRNKLPRSTTAVLSTTLMPIKRPFQGMRHWTGCMDACHVSRYECSS